MLSENIAAIYRLLDCNNSKIARMLGYSPSEISRLRSGKRSYGPTSRPVLRFAEGVYLYADSVGAVSPLAALCGAPGRSREEVVPALAAWLFDKSSADAPAFLPMMEESLRAVKEKRRRFFGEKLGEVMELLEISNLRLARQINVDASTVSRFRSGVRSPKPPMDRLLAAALMERARSQGAEARLARLCGVPEEALDEAALAGWFYDGDSDALNYSFAHIDDLLDSIERFPAGSPPLPSDLTPPAPASEGDRGTYWGIRGLREAVIRFLSSAAREGGELLLYSDQDMEWMVGDPDFRARWAALMAACVRAGVRMRVVHNTDRSVPEMLSAIQSWLPLYMSGRIKPYVCRLAPDARFSTTLFLRPGAECILSSHLRGCEDTAWYEYITEPGKVESAAGSFNGLLAGSIPLVNIYFDSDTIPFDTDRPDEEVRLLMSGLSFGTMPTPVLTAILDRSGLDLAVRETILRSHAFQADWFKKRLAAGKVREYVTLPSDERLFAGGVRVNLGRPLQSSALFYSPEEYAAHAQAVITLLQTVPNYELVLLPQQPFARIQIVAADSRVSVGRMGAPCVDFVFSESRMVRSFVEYFAMLEKQYRTDRSDVQSRLSRFL